MSSVYEMRYDGRRCPVCGSFAERIGKQTVEHIGGEVVFGFVLETIAMSHHSNNREVSPNDRGAVAVSHEEEIVSFGQKRKTGNVTYRLEITHWCMNEDCAVVFAGGSR